MKYVKEALLVIILMLPLTLYAAPHEPSPAGGGWLELNPELQRVQTKKPWFPDYPGPITIEAWVYIDRPPSVRDVISLAAGSRAAFSIVGQTDRFTCAIVGDGYKASPAIVTSGVEGGSGKI
ncbi:LamG domain-containing protein [Candidatus Poribacteria bacterium]|nr:LamG domain-containing protein [Candidatus Poribacteria bacterium]MYH81745.1 LamG domain-containing protein [Candidatus Poribacteria bacterium]MYK96840.1 LamG domain-containing protein [Candidatus Poribacteria bacterium]